MYTNACICYLGGWGQVSLALNTYSALESFRLACEGAETHFQNLLSFYQCAMLCINGSDY